MNTFKMFQFGGSRNNKYDLTGDTVCRQPSYQARYLPSDSPAGSALRLISGLILGFITNLNIFSTGQAHSQATSPAHL